MKPISFSWSAAMLFVVACASPPAPDPALDEASAELTAAQCDYFKVNGKVRICHATTSSTHPFTVINISTSECIHTHALHARDYVAVGDPTCQGGGCLPAGAPADPTLPCCGGLVVQNGVCTDLCAGVTCTASDSCHVAGTCDPATGTCSNPSAADGTTCNDGNDCTQTDVCSAGTCAGTAYTCPSPGGDDECHVGVCNGDGTCGVGNAPDGTTCCGPIPAGYCDDTFNGSCSGGTCSNINACGDGTIELGLGESCDDGNLVNGDGCDASCHVEPFETTQPVKISGALACTTATANAARKIAIDGSGTIYAVMNCGGVANVVVSTDRGDSFSAPLDLSTGLSPASVSEVAVATGPSGVAYVAIMLADNQVFLRTTQDRGATWTAAILIGTTTNSTAGLSLQSFNDDIYIGFARPGGVSVARNHNRGAGAFAITPVAMGVVFFDLIFDIKLGTLAVCADTPTFHVRVSSDDGVSFAAEVNPPGVAFFSDWAIGDGQIFVSGAATPSLFIIPASAPSTSTFVNGLPVVFTFQTRSLAADDAGNAFVATQLDSGGVQLDRLAAGTTTFDAPRVLDVTGGSPIVAALPGNTGAAVVYTRGSEVWVTVQAY
jgi:cysteine-rich repeat protein